MKLTPWTIFTTLLFFAQPLYAQNLNTRLPNQTKKPIPITQHQDQKPETSKPDIKPDIVHPFLKLSKEKHRERVLNTYLAQYGATSAEPSISPKKPLPPAGGVRPFIIGGTDVPVGKRGYQVSVLSAYGYHYCGGALIDRQWILTAAHCASSVDIAAGISVMLNTNNLDDPNALIIPVSEVIRHPEYDDRTLDYDVALLRLAFPAPSHLPLLSLVDEDLMQDHAFPGQVATASGWGLIDLSGVMTPQLQEVDVPIVDTAECRAAYEAEYFPFTDNMICAGYPEGGRDTCYGDSGGPLTIDIGGQDHSVGIVSWGAGCALPGFPGVYTRTASVHSWIVESMNTPVTEVTSFAVEDGLVISAEALTERFYSFTLTESVGNLQIELSGGNGLAQMSVYNSAYIMPDFISCRTGNEFGQASCSYTITGPGTYTVGIYGITDLENIQLSIDFQPLVIGNNTVLNNIQLTPGQQIPLYFTLDEPVSNFLSTFSAPNGDTDLYLVNLDTGSVCGEFSYDSYESCYVETLDPGHYVIMLVGYVFTDQGTFILSYQEDLPFFPKAICQHSVVQQIGKYFIATITITNVSDEYLHDWYVTWDYAVPTSIDLILNGVVTSTEPYKVENNNPGLALRPGGSTNVYMIVKSPQGVSKNPTVTGNYCF
jgi:trypsin